VTLTEDWSIDTENTALITGINYILQYIQIENIEEHNRLSETLKNLCTSEL